MVGEQNQEVLKGINLEIGDGEMVSIQGSSCSGKSTLLHILAGLESSDAGEYYLGDVLVTRLGDEKMSRLRNEQIGIVLQDYVLLNQQSVLFNVMLPMYFNKTPLKEMKKRAMAALEMIGLKDMYRKSANKLSGGERQRVAIARAIVNNPKVILADEPTGALDFATGQEIVSLLTKINQTGTTVIIVTHDDNVANQCKRQFVMSDGILCEKE